MFEDELTYNYLDLLSPVEEEKMPEYPLPVVIKDIEGNYLIDKNGNKYLDFTSCRENHPLGYSGMLADQACTFFDSGLFKTEEAVKLENRLQNLTGLKKAYFASSRGECYQILNSLLKAHI